jgi:hypothetical protein
MLPIDEAGVILIKLIWSDLHPTYLYQQDSGRRARTRGGPQYLCI